MLQLGLIVCTKLKINVSANSVTFQLNIVSTKLWHKNENRQIDFNAFDLQKIKRVGQSFLYFDNFYSIVIYLSFVIIYDIMHVLIHTYKDRCMQSVRFFILFQHQYFPQVPVNFPACLFSISGVRLVFFSHHNCHVQCQTLDLVFMSMIYY